ncbi:hypothetical protein LAV77_27510 [Priestia megaterium]|uniref:hypothetical protein n=1 Tax=Priestia megaterium TaxID=1404 RepID=UPI002B247D84|nr:hypothetical protein [Priestia megaterium]MEB2268522.1 hypothetical protein [Priestia megaterium]
MPMLSAICDNCKSSFSSGISIEGSKITLSGNTAGPCPKCVGIGRITDGTFNFIDNSIAKKVKKE